MAQILIKTKVCPVCHGKGHKMGCDPDNYFKWGEIPCFGCLATGFVSERMAAALARGKQKMVSR